MTETAQDALTSLINEIMVNIKCPDLIRAPYTEVTVGAGFYGEVILALDDHPSLVCTYDHYNARTRRTTFVLRDRTAHGLVELFFDGGVKFSVIVTGYDAIMDMLHDGGDEPCDLCWSLDQVDKFGKGKN